MTTALASGAPHMGFAYIACLLNAVINQRCHHDGCSLHYAPNAPNHAVDLIVTLQPAGMYEVWLEESICGTGAKRKGRCRRGVSI